MRRYNASDIAAMAGHWNQHEAEAVFDPTYDLNDEGVIDIVDIMWVAARWGDTCDSALTSR